MKQIERWILGLFSSVDNTMLGFFTKIGPYITAAIPALLAGYGISQYFDSTFGMIIGFTVGIGMEAAGIKIIHTAIEYSDAHPGRMDTRFILLVSASLLFVCLVSATIYTSDQAYPQMVRIIGAISPTLAAMAYFALGVERSLLREGEGKREMEMMNADFEKQRRVLDLQAEQQKQEAELRILAAKNEAEIHRIEAQANAEEKRLEAMGDAEATRLQIKAQEGEHQREMELERLRQKQERALRKMESAADSPIVGGEGQAKKPFKRYDEFAEYYAETQDLSDISTRMSVQMGTIRGYKRKFDQFNADDADNAADEIVSQNEQELSDVVALQLNGHA